MWSDGTKAHTAAPPTAVAVRNTPVPGNSTRSPGPVLRSRRRIRHTSWGRIAPYCWTRTIAARVGGSSTRAASHPAGGGITRRVSRPSFPRWSISTARSEATHSADASPSDRSHVQHRCAARTR